MFRLCYGFKFGFVLEFLIRLILFGLDLVLRYSVNNSSL